jgi:hypothetical protein
VKSFDHSCNTSPTQQHNNTTTQQHNNTTTQQHNNTTTTPRQQGTSPPRPCMLLLVLVLTMAGEPVEL